MCGTLWLPGKIERIGKPSARTTQHLTIDGVGKVFLAKHFFLTGEFLNQIGKERNFIIQTKLKRCKSSLHHTCARVMRLHTEHLGRKFLCLINAPAVECYFGVDGSSIDIPFL